MLNSGKLKKKHKSNIKLSSGNENIILQSQKLKSKFLKLLHIKNKKSQFLEKKTIW